jgi:hypothetical protein
MKVFTRWEQASRRGLLLLSLFSLPLAATSRTEHAIASVAWVSDQVPGAAAIDDAFSRVMKADPDLGRAVDDLERAVRSAGSPWDAAQLLASAYNVVGRYADSRAIRDAHRRQNARCVFSGDSWPEGLRRLPKSVSVLLINEDHIDSTTRANLLAALPTLRSQGFTQLAMEALPDPSVGRALSGGTVPDEATTGVYLRDPVEAALVREAVRLGFHLHAYDSSDDFDVRERSQARRLLHIANSHPGRLVVFAGPGHVQLDGNWMGALLARDLGKKLYTIDQVSGAGADCEGPGEARLVSRDPGKAGHLIGTKTDAALVSPALPAGERDAANSWLTLGTLRKPFRVESRQLCPGATIRCLISARRQGSSPGDVPEDRYLAGGSWRGYLFVEPGTYEITGIDEKGHRHTVPAKIDP